MGPVAPVFVLGPSDAATATLGLAPITLNGRKTQDILIQHILFGGPSFEGVLGGNVRIYKDTELDMGVHRGVWKPLCNTYGYVGVNGVLRAVIENQMKRQQPMTWKL